MGRSAIMSEITIENRGENDYEDLAVEVDFYTANDIPLGSLRTTIKEILPAKSEKTFYNLNFGIMHSELKNSVARVVNAELIEKGSPTQAKDLILVKNWECCKTAQAANVRELLLFHHAPERTDAELEAIEAKAHALFPGATAARDGHIVKLA